MQLKINGFLKIVFSAEANLIIAKVGFQFGDSVSELLYFNGLHICHRSTEAQNV
jgi:hypothetical protein